MTVAVAAVFDLRYHVPRSQVWGGSRGKQHGNVHLHVKQGESLEVGRIRRGERQALCGRRGWYERAPDQFEAQQQEQFCARCLEIAGRAAGEGTR